MLKNRKNVLRVVDQPLAIGPKRTKEVGRAKSIDSGATHAILPCLPSRESSNDTPSSLARLSNAASSSALDSRAGSQRPLGVSCAGKPLSSTLDNLKAELAVRTSCDKADKIRNGFVRVWYYVLVVLEQPVTFPFSMGYNRAWVIG